MPVLKKQVVQDFHVQVEVAMKSLDSFSLLDPVERPKAPNMEAMPTPITEKCEDVLPSEVGIILTMTINVTPIIINTQVEASRKLGESLRPEGRFSPLFLL